MPRTPHRFAPVILATIVACYRGLDHDGDGGAADGAADGGADTGADDGVFACEHPELRGQGDLAMRRLTREELLHSIEAVVSPAVMQDDAVLAATAKIPPESPGDLVADFQNGYAVEHATGVLLTAQAVATAVGNDANARAAVFGACGAQADAVCAGTFLETVGRRLLKRPLSAAGRASMLDGFAAEGGGLAGMQWLLARMLQSPEVLFHLDLVRRTCDDAGVCTDAPADQGVVPLDDFSVAARVAFGLTGQGPDDQLLDAAAAGELRTPEAVLPHAERLLATPAARRQLASVLDSWLMLSAAPAPNATLLALAGIDGAGLEAEARQELLDYAAWLVFELDADAEALLTSKVGFPRSARLAGLYGSEVASGAEPVDLTGGHGGLLVRLAPLLSGHLHTSPILRGAYVRKRMLCDALGTPDPGAVSAANAQLDGSDRTTHSNRELIEEITAPGGCAACHALINPLGFALEGFDPLGRRRTEEIVYAADGSEIARHPIDTVVGDVALEDGTVTDIGGATDLVAAVAESTKVRACIAQRLYTHARLRAATQADGCVLAEVQQALVDGASVREAWTAAIVNPELFVRKAEGSP